MADIVPFQLTPQQILRIIRELVLDTSKIDWQQALEKRMGPINTRQVLRCLAEGCMTYGPYLDEYGNTCCELERICAGQEIRVVVSIEGRSPRDRRLHILYAEEV